MYFPHFVFSLALWLAFNNIKINVVPLTSHQKAVEFLLCFITNLTFQNQELHDTNIETTVVKTGYLGAQFF